MEHSIEESTVNIVQDFIQSLKDGRSKVKQMIMGAGKTTVVAPLLALMLANGDDLVLSVVPRALLKCLESVCKKPFNYCAKTNHTLNFDRSTNVKSSLTQSLENAVKNRGIVVATPTAIKSVFLVFVEKKRQIKYAAQNSLTSEDIKKLEVEIKILINTLKMFKQGVMLLDEVDLLLHPLKSELNFPLGEKFDLDGSEDGARWNLVMHIMDAIFLQPVVKYRNLNIGVKLRKYCRN